MNKKIIVVLFYTNNMKRYTSDLHLNHKNILKYDKRPFNSIEEHDKGIIDNINSLVKETDELYIL